ncbi:MULTISPECIES: alpha/beta hydrolase family protein [Corynebacterium]|uniref:alpha/beta hydrolase n=1 Tax=Corynebacterium TaxID=1716 RepID=UPI001CE45571|nr:MULTISPECIES: alpha/beta hydrolase family protein [Corynebacterium]
MLNSLSKRVLAALVAIATALGVAAVATPGASADNRGWLRPGCTWSDYKYFVQNCWVHSPAMDQMIQVQIKPASRGGDAGLYLLDGLRARDDWNAWTYLGNAPKHFVDDNITLVMPVGGASQFYTDWSGPWMGNNGPARPRWETFLTRELPGYLQQNFGVSPSNNAIAGISMGATAALNLAAHHRNQFKQASSLSGYLNPTWPGMYSAIGVAMVDASGPGAQVWNMWGSPVDPRRFQNDPLLQAGAFRGMPLYLSAASGLTTNENVLEDPYGVSVGVGLEWMSRTSTAKFELAARVAGADVQVSYPAFGIHAWPYWDRELGNARGQILRATGA